MSEKGNAGLVGLGLVGTALAKRLLGAGLKVTGFDIDAARRDAFAALGGAVADLVTKRKLDGDTIDELEEVLFRADLGIDVAAKISAAVGQGRYDKSVDRKSTRLNSSHVKRSRMPSSA